MTTEPTTAGPPVRPRAGTLGALVRASHAGPTVAVTVLTALLTVALDLTARPASLVTAAVFTGQLTIGWSNDLLDAGRDRAVHRADKPVARGEVSTKLVRTAIGAAGLTCLVLSMACGWRSGLAHLLLGVGSGWAYNLGLKRTGWSALPYAVAFGILPAVVSLAGPDRGWPPGWMVATGALLGVGAHLLNALPDLADDAATGVHGLPQRLGAARVRMLAPAVLLAGSAVATLGPAGTVPAWSWTVLGGCVLLTVVAVVGRGRVPFLAAIGIALVDVVALLAR
ncbi:4-hydroxybenzoate polyprenyltransferase [Pedococcus dokdonensis]|uniref:4-hydroxybenzoate polyprenyltransferase n=1 Tax=Pedococcus dokdonensis TaxID=443156 RepID=A0A1H0UAZ1_9MICO|nr:UbiA family prenyltransferase [Pedococcus dokdonensis]SDP63339.1 4-hydroxybenzoate polyprenyltransferase [Pedococcus dokdonensis]